MAIAKNSYFSVEDYLKMRESREELFEYIDGIVYMSPSPLTKHQRISRV